MRMLVFCSAGWLLLVGCYGLVISRNLIHSVVSLVVCQSSTYVALLGVGYRSGATSPVFGDISAKSKVVDPVVQAMTLTDIVVSATVIALFIALAIQVHKREGTIEPDELQGLKG
jgi:multicomponent Na+:H+ antiporter subunit C